MEVELISFLRDYLAPRETMHGVLVNVYGSGLLITGESGVGKSETAIELVKRGHQLVADDVVDIRRVSDDRLVGESPELVRHFMEIRGGHHRHRHHVRRGRGHPLQDHRSGSQAGNWQQGKDTTGWA